MINEVDLKTLWKELDTYEVELGEEENTLREVWVKMALLKEKNERDAEEYVFFFFANSKPRKHLTLSLTFPHNNNNTD